MLTPLLHGQHRDAAQKELGQKLNNGAKHTDYVKEAMQAKAEKDADDEKVERPLAEAMVREGYMRKKGPTLSERAVDHTEMPQDAVKEIAKMSGIQLEVRGV